MSGTKKVKAFSEKYDRIAGARALLMIMKIFGIWKWNDKNDSSLATKILQNLHRYVIHVPGSVIFCLLMWVDAFQASDLVQAGNVLYMSICLSVYNLKLLSVWILYSKNKQFINDLECNPVFELSTETEKAMWLSQQRTFYFVVAVFMCGSILSGVAGFYGAIIAEDYQLGFDYYVPFEWRNPRYYWVAQAYDIMGICTCCFSNIAVDMLGCYQIFHIALLYKLLSLRFGELQTTKETEIMEKLLRCLQLQRNIRRYVIMFYYASVSRGAQCRWSRINWSLLEVLRYLFNFSICDCIEHNGDAQWVKTQTNCNEDWHLHTFLQPIFHV